MTKYYIILLLLSNCINLYLKKISERKSERTTKAPHAVPILVCQGPSFYLQFLVKKGHNSTNIAFRVMPLPLQLHLVMMSKYTKFGVDTFSTF